MDPKLPKTIQTHVKGAQEELANLLQRLIRIRSYSGEEKEIIAVTVPVSRINRRGGRANGSC